MTNKELLYVEDALGHEKFMKTSSCSTSSQLKDVNLSNFIPSIQISETVKGRNIYKNYCKTSQMPHYMLRYLLLQYIFLLLRNN